MPKLDLRNMVRVDENLTERMHIVDRLKERKSPTKIWATHLINLRKAYCEFKYPQIKDTLEAKARKGRGIKFHELFERAVVQDPFREQTVEFEGIRGKIDIYKEKPIELKTTARLPSKTTGLPIWADYAEQVGIYCVMTTQLEGAVLVHLTGRENDVDFNPNGELRAFKVKCSTLTEVYNEVIRRRDLLKHALDYNDPSALPVCSWCGAVECIFEKVCNPTGLPKTKNEICQFLTVTESPEDAEWFKKKLLLSYNFLDEYKQLAEGYSPWELLMQKQTFFNRLYGRRADDSEEALGFMSRKAKQSWLKDELIYASKDEFAYKLLQQGDILWRRALYHHGLPTIIQRCWLYNIPPRERIPVVFANEIHLIGLQAAVENVTKGRLIVEYPRVADENVRVMVYDIHFLCDTKPFLEFAVTRAKNLKKALAEKNAVFLEDCDGWRCEKCTYKERCKTPSQK